MIVALQGVLEAKGPDWVQVRVGGVSLQVSVPPSTIGEVGSPGEDVRLHTHLIVKEDGLALYGFSTPEALRLFHLLIGVNGIGPKTALALLSALGPYNLAGAIVSGDEGALGQAPGVGKRLASRIVLELKEKLEKEGVPATTAAGTGDGDVLAALMALGYSGQEARRAIADLGASPGATMEERLRQALQRLGRG